VSTATSHLSQARARLAELLDEPAQNQAQREMTEDGRP
jgi:hypothetical protein